MGCKRWCHVDALYQIYPRSFQDDNNDGIGDIPGIIKRLDYLKGHDSSLGVDAIWLSPFFPSPQADMGYDVSNYCDVDPMFGTLDDFRQLLDEAHKRNIKVMIDFVPNHTSNQHPWFLESQSSRDNPKSDWYTWRDPNPDGSVPNNWISQFSGSVWEWNETRKQYYLHSFLKEQPDLNWDNPDVRKEMQNVLRFWFDLGVDGIRADAVRWISKDPQLRDDPILPTYRGEMPPKSTDGYLHKYSCYYENLFPYLREMTDVVQEYDDRIMVFEHYPDNVYSTKEQYLGFYGVNPEVSMPFNFEGIGAKFYADAYRTLVNEFQGMIDPDRHTPVYCFSNHDQARIATRLGGAEQARLVALMQLTLPGIPVVYYGDEIGMPNTTIQPTEVRDQSAIVSGDLTVSRDPQRTPMQWNDSEFAGFSTVKPWLPIGQTLAAHNVLHQQAEPDSFFALYQRLLKMRHQYEILRHGEYEPFGELDVDLFTFARWLGKEQHVFVVLNFGKEQRTVEIPHEGRVLCSTHPVDYPLINKNTVTVRPFEGVLIECIEHPIKQDLA